jgi:protein-S-isoprenylcysteine O-methyltransferase Ste14
MSSPLDNRIPPPLVTLATGLIMGGAAAFLPATAMPAIVRFGVLGGVLLVGGIFGARAFAAFGRARTTINPVNIEAASTLVTTGIYSVSRNPMYVGLTALLVALALALSNAWLLLGPLFFVVFTTRFQIIPEERAMLAKFGTDFVAYRQRVRRWL